ncbi:MAG: carbohydrate binding family 9 domain-containing protein, partial [Acidobacteria bacterium]|nr:carbohydrate binding family 9 domain-containing protein [Acidobacteriota bacterium]
MMTEKNTTVIWKITSIFTRFIFVTFFLIITLWADNEKVPYRIPKVLDSIKISVDGNLDEPFWQKALMLELKYEVMPGENTTPPVKTEVLLTYTDDCFYAAFRAFDPEPSDIRAVYTDRDNCADHDFVGIVLDTFNDERRTYDFRCNPFGIQTDGSTTLQGWVEWDAIWDSAGKITKDGYIVEIAIPFSSMRFQRQKGDQVWGIDAIRSYPRNVKHSIGLFPKDRNNNCYTCQFEKIIGFEGTKPGKNIEFDPTVSTLISQGREPFSTGEFDKKTKIKPGLTARWGFTPNLTLSATINPDFSQVEADVAQLDINTRFALFYPEKRPFFMEGADIFNMPLDAVYTRSLSEPDWGIKLTGKEGVHSIGFYSVQDKSTYLLFPGTQFSNSTTIDMKTLGSVLRYRLDMGKASHIGLLATDREISNGDDQDKNYYNRLVGFDGYWRINRKKHLEFQFLTSRTCYPVATANKYEQPVSAFAGSAMEFLFQHETRDFGYYAGYRQISPGFRADLGFIPQIGLRRIRGGIIAASWKDQGHWYTFLNIKPSFDYFVDFNGKLISKYIRLTSFYEGPSQTSGAIEARFGKQSYFGQLFSTNQGELFVNIQPTGSLFFGLDTIYGNQIDFENIRQGVQLVLAPSFTCKIGRHIYLGLDHIFERLNVEHRRLYTANVSNLRLVYQFNARFFLRTILQYVDYNYNVDNYLFQLDPRYKRLFSQVLFSYKVNPQT